MRASDRKDRLAAALRENLKRRKARDRALKDAAKPADGAGAPALPETRPNIAAKPG